MGKTATILGREFDRSAQEMNGLLKEHGYLDGEPGDYQLTEKGRPYGKEHDHHRGPGGYSRYNADWTFATWNDDTAGALRADMAAEAPQVDDAPDDDAPGADDSHSASLDHDGSGIRLPSARTVVVVAAVVVGACVVAPRLKPVWDEKLRPKMMRMRQKLVGREPAVPDGADEIDGRPEATA